MNHDKLFFRDNPTPEKIKKLMEWCDHAAPLNF